MRYKSEVVFEDDDLIIINKAPGISSVADRFDTSAPHLLKWVNQQFETALPVHRLDHDTSGLICFAKNRDTQAHLSAAFSNREVEKRYKAIILGVPNDSQGSIDARIFKPENKNQVFISPKGKTALTNFWVEKKYKGYALLDIEIKTGRTHQIRIHLKHIGHPLLVDPLYGGKDCFLLSSIKHRYRGEKVDEKPLLNRTPLHAYSLGLPMRDGTIRKFTTPMPKDMAAVLNQFDKLLSLI
jgi:23S rRNA pseudouridine955/2504/2580 synthase/23S rRNA pseudouridine1911/1915/1917 synthase